MDIEVKEEVEQRTQQAERFEGKQNSLKGSACSLAHSLVYSLTLLPLRGTFTAPLCEGRSAQFVRFVYFLFTPTAHAQARLPLSFSFSLSLFLFVAAPTRLHISFLPDFWRSLSRSLACSPALVSHSSSSPSPPLSSFRRTKGKCLNSPRIELTEATLSAFV